MPQIIKSDKIICLKNVVRIQNSFKIILSGFLSFSADLETLLFVLSLFLSVESLAFNATASSSGDLSSSTGLKSQKNKVQKQNIKTMNVKVQV